MDFCQPILIITCFSWLKFDNYHTVFVFFKISSEPAVDAPLRVKRRSCGRQRWMIYDLLFIALIKFIVINSHPLQKLAEHVLQGANYLLLNLKNSMWVLSTLRSSTPVRQQHVVVCVILPWP